VSAAKAATSTIPIVFAGTDPVEDGLVESFNRPGGNATDYTIWTNRIESKRLGLLHELVPNVRVYGLLLSPSSPFAARLLQELEEAAPRLGKRIFAAYAGNDTDLDGALGILSHEQVGALLVTASAYTRRQRIIALAAQYRIPTHFHFREYVVDGGAHQLWAERNKCPPARRRIRWSHSQRSQPKRSTCRAGKQIRAHSLE
jgi:putative ABC transport system substrate-binding protein